MRYSWREHMDVWRVSHPQERILEVDLPLSMGLFEVTHDRLNACEFTWDAAQETAAYLRVNCVSTEFTPRKHGGEKGVPFKLLVETFRVRIVCDSLR